MTEVEVQFSATPRVCDAQGMVHASRYLDFFEDAFLAWLERQAGGYAAVRAAGMDLVIGHLEVSYQDPARLGDVLAVRASSLRSSRSTIVIGFEVRIAARLLVQAEITYVVVRSGRPAPLPEVLKVPTG